MRLYVPFLHLTIIMKLSFLSSKSFLFALMAFSAVLTSCSSSENGVDNGGDEVVKNNVNSNLKEANQYTHRMEVPRLGKNSVILVHTLRDGEVNYTVEWDTLKKSNRWTCYEMYASNRETHTKRYRPDDYTKQYPQDPLLENKYRLPGDPLRRSGHDHGHLCPSADRLNSSEANYQTFFLTNMMPQVHGFNAGTWEKMESWVRNQVNASSRDTLFVVKGGTIDNSSQYTTMDRTGGKLIIPKYYYMAVLMHNATGYKAMGFWIEHKVNSDGNLGKYVVNIRELERLTGLDFFCNLPDDTESHVEELNVEQVRRAWGL